jgi:hypothetical protein
MGGLRGRLRRLEEAAEEEIVTIPQKDGTTARFPQSESLDALLSLIDGRDHPLAEAVRNSPDPKWANSFYSAFPIDQDAEDLSE